MHGIGIDGHFPGSACVGEGVESDLSIAAWGMHENELDRIAGNSFLLEVSCPYQGFFPEQLTAVHFGTGENQIEIAVFH